MAISVLELRRRCFSNEDIRAAQEHQRVQRAADAPVASLSEILTGDRAPRRDAPPVDLRTRQLRRRGVYGQAALLLDQAALGEADPSRAADARRASHIAKTLARPQQLEFDFWSGGNMVQADQYHDAIRTRLLETARTSTEAALALAVLQEIKRHLGWQDFTCTKTAVDLCDLLSMDKGNMARHLALLEQVGAISRVKRGRSKVISVTPEGAFRGNLDKHAEVMERYKAEVVPLHPHLHPGE